MSYNNIFDAPKIALQLMLRNKVLFVLAFLPGLITIVAASLGIFSIWNWWLASWDVYLFIKVFIAALIALILWLAVGNLALIPFEDPIIDLVQKDLLGEIRTPAQPLHIVRLMKEVFYSLTVSVFFLLLVLLSAIPGIALISYLVAAWVTSWNFLATYYARSTTNASSKLSLFFRNPVENAFLGAFINLLLFVPLINVWLLGYALILATVVHIRRVENLSGAQR